MNVETAERGADLRSGWADVDLRALRGWVSALGCLAADVVEYLGHHSGLCDERDDPHFGTAFKAGQRFDFKDAAQHLSPLTPETPALGGGGQIVVGRRFICSLLLL